jgi:integrase
LAVFGSLRWGELAALRRRHIDLASGTVHIEEAVVELADGSRVTGPPKSPASRRIVSISGFLLLMSNLTWIFSMPGEDSIVFVGPKGAPLRRPNFSRAWRQATTSAALPGIHFHDLRHTGNTMAGEAGASLRELMDRMGHSSLRAALIYQHRSGQRDKMVADAISDRVSAELADNGHATGTEP